MNFVFNGLNSITHLQTPGHTLGVHFELTQNRYRRTQFPSMLTDVAATPVALHHLRQIDFRAKFNPNTSNDEVYACVVDHNHRRYLVVGTFREGLPAHNLAVKNLLPHSAFKGDIAIFFLAKNRNLDLFLYRIPRFQNRDHVFRTLLKAFIANVRRDRAPGPNRFKHTLHA